MIPLLDGDTKLELSEAALLLALGAILTPEQIGAWLTAAAKVQSAMDAQPDHHLGFNVNRVLRPDQNGGGIVAP